MKKITFGQYYPADSVIHRMDARAKIVSAILYIVAVFLCKNALCFAALALSAVLLVALSRIPLRLVLSTLKPLIVIITLTSLINIFFTKGEILLTPETWKVHVYAEGLWNALFMVLRITVLLASTGVFLTFTTTPIALTEALW